MPASPDSGEEPDAEVSRQFSEDVRHAFEEDCAVLSAVQAGMEKSPSSLNLPLDAGPIRFRRKLQKMIEAEPKTKTR